MKEGRNMKEDERRKEDDHEGLVLNRVVRWTCQGIEYEGDPMQAEKLIRDTELHGANAVTTPGVKPLAYQLEKEEPLSMAGFTRFRRQAGCTRQLPGPRSSRSDIFSEGSVQRDVVPK